MKKFKYVYHQGMGFKLTFNKIYDVISEDCLGGTITIKNDNDRITSYFISEGLNIYFKDVTSEYRSDIIGDILN